MPPKIDIFINHYKIQSFFNYAKTIGGLQTLGTRASTAHGTPRTDHSTSKIIKRAEFSESKALATNIKRPINRQDADDNPGMGAQPARTRRVPENLMRGPMYI